MIVFKYQVSIRLKAKSITDRTIINQTFYLRILYLQETRILRKIIFCLFKIPDNINQIVTVCFTTI